MLARALRLRGVRRSVRYGSRNVRAFSDEKGFRGALPEGSTPEKNFGTMCLYAGNPPDPATGARTTPINMSTGFVFKDSEDAASKFMLQAFGPIYTRIGNPTCDAVEAKIAALEGGMAALAVSSGHASQMLAFTNLMSPGDNFITTNKLYGGTVTQFSQTFKRFGWEARFAPQDDFSAIESMVDAKTKAIYCESIANPGGIITDLEALARIANNNGIPLIVDNTSASPYLCRPFEFGASVVLHSATKFLGGHGNAVGGLIVEKGDFDWGGGKFPHLSEPSPSYNNLVFNDVFGKDGPVAEMFGTKGQTGMAFAIAARAVGLRDVGACISPMNAFLINMGMETLPLRMEKCVGNAQKVAEFLASNPKVEWVQYAGLPGDKYYDLAQKYTPKGAGSLFTFGVKGGYDAGKAVVDGVQMVSLVANLGDTRSLIAHPASMMHSQLSEEERAAAGAPPEALRLSIGIEEPDDIIADLAQALDRA